MRLLPLLLLAACATSHAVRPLPRGTGALTASIGGPISADLPTPIPFAVPITTVGYAHGATDRTTVHGAIHPTGLAAFGIFAMDAGAAVQLVDTAGARPRVMLDGDLIFATGNAAPGVPRGGTRLFPDLQLVASWDLGPHAVYGGLDNLVQLFPTPVYDPSLLAGTMLHGGRTDVSIEYMWQAFPYDNDPVAAQFLGPAGYGASAVKVGLGVRLGRKEDT